MNYQNCEIYCTQISIYPIAPLASFKALDVVHLSKYLQLQYLTLSMASSIAVENQVP